MNYNPSYTLQQQQQQQQQQQSTPSPSSSLSLSRSTPTPPTPLSDYFPQQFHLPPIRIPASHYKNTREDFPHPQPYPTSAPYNQQPSPNSPILPPPHQSVHSPSPTSDPTNNSMSSRGRLPPLTSTPPTSYFPNGYASPATSTYSSEPGSRDEMDILEPAANSDNNNNANDTSFHRPLSPTGVDGMNMREESGIYFDNSKFDSSQRDNIRERQCRKRWTMRDFTLIQTVGTPTIVLALMRKILSKAECVRLRQVEHVNSEREILASVRHPFIVDMFLTFQTPSNLFMCLEYMVGGELFSHLRKHNRFVPDVAKFYAACIVLALEYLHENDIIYRDLKPEVTPSFAVVLTGQNLLLDQDGYIKIIDFGFSKQCPDRTWTVCGTPEYLAPEIIRSDGHGKAVDWWALGILTYEMLVGYPPYYDSYPLGIYEKILAGNLTFPAFIDSTARDLIRQLLRPDLSSRLGNLRGGAQDVKDHMWFRLADWDKLLQKRFRAPFVPRARWEGDAQYFERYEELSGEEVENLMNEDEGYGEDFEDMFAGF